MNRTDFWRLVDGTRGQPDRAEALAARLAELPDEDIVRSRIIYDDLIHAANKVDLWGAAHVINGGCTEDEFYLFREGLIEHGQHVFEAAVQDPESLLNVATPGQRLEGTEGLGNAAAMAWVSRKGGEEEAFYEEVDRLDEATSRADPEEGEWWDFTQAAEVRHRFPRLAEKFLKAGAE